MKQFSGFQKGVNLGGWLSQCPHTKAHYDSFISSDDIRVIAGWGADHIRLPIDYEVFEAPDGTWLDCGFARVAEALKWCKDCGLNLVIDLHKTAGYSFDSGEAESGLFDSEALQERFYRLWEEIARRFGGETDCVVFELLNEVTDKAFSDKWNEVAEICVKRIRAIAPDMRILLGGYWNNSIVALPDLPMPFDDKIIYNFHCYEPILFTHQGAQWIENMPADLRIGFPGSAEEYHSIMQGLNLPVGDIFAMARNAKSADFELFDRLFADAAAVAEQRGTTLYCGEYGVIDTAADEDTVAWYAAIHRAFEKYGIGRAAWSYRRMNFGISDPERESIRQKLTELL